MSSLKSLWLLILGTQNSLNFSDKCGDEVFQDVSSHTWTQLATCPSESCKRNKTNGTLVMQTRACKFIKFQEVKVQELASLYLIS